MQRGKNQIRGQFLLHADTKRRHSVVIQRETNQYSLRKLSLPRLQSNISCDAAERSQDQQRSTESSQRLLRVSVHAEEMAR